MTVLEALLCQKLVTELVTTCIGLYFARIWIFLSNKEQRSLKIVNLEFFKRWNESSNVQEIKFWGKEVKLCLIEIINVSLMLSRKCNASWKSWMWNFFCLNRHYLEPKREQKEHFYVEEISCHSQGLWEAAAPL